MKEKIVEEAEGEHVKSRISEGKKLIEERIREYAQESGIVIREVAWYSIPGKVSHYVFMVSIGGKPEESGFLAEELAGLLADSKSADKKLRALVNEIKKNGTYLPIQRHS